MTPATNDSLARAIDYLGAVEVAPGRYAFRFGVGHGWRMIDPRVLPGMKIDPDAFGGGDKYYQQVGLFNSVQMPSWWSPEQRFAWQHGDGCQWDKTYRKDCYCGTQRITADLATGQEAPA